MKRFFNILLTVALCLSMVLSSAMPCCAGKDTSTVWDSSVSVYAECAVLIDAQTGTILYDKKCHQEMYPASITKIMTALLTLENCKLTDEVEFSENAINSLVLGDAHIAIVPGEILSVEECLYGLMLASANEVAIGLAEHISGSVDSFADLMNERAKKAGALNTHFANPNGLHDEDHYTSAYDMAMITRAAIDIPLFTTITSTTSYIIGTTNKTDEKRYVSQRHKMVWENSGYYYEGCMGGKTGYTDQAGTTLVTFAKRNNMTLICVVLNSNAANVYTDTSTLLDYGFNNFSLAEISENENIATGLATDTPALTSVFSQQKESLSLKDGEYVILPDGVSFSDLSGKVSFVSNNTDSDSNSSSATSGIPVATIEYSYQDNVVGTGTIIYNKSVPASASVDNSAGEETTSDSSAVSGKQTTSDSFKLPGWFIPFIIAIIIISCIIISFKMWINHINDIRNQKRNRTR